MCRSGHPFSLKWGGDCETALVRTLSHIVRRLCQCFPVKKNVQDVFLRTLKCTRNLWVELARAS